jgi:hypothetical protein
MGGAANRHARAGDRAAVYRGDAFTQMAALTLIA